MPGGVAAGAAWAGVPNPPAPACEKPPNMEGLDWPKRPPPAGFCPVFAAPNRPVLDWPNADSELG